MAKTVWTAADDIRAFNDGRRAVEAGHPRIPDKTYATYNERAAFNNGWDVAAKELLGAGKPKRTGPANAAARAKQG